MTSAMVALVLVLAALAVFAILDVRRAYRARVERRRCLARNLTVLPRKEDRTA